MGLSNSNARLDPVCLETFGGPVRCPGRAHFLVVVEHDSDHWAFWQAGYPGLMVTDTAPFRYPHYHTEQDTPDKLDYERLARVVTGLDEVLREMVNK